MSKYYEHSRIPDSKNRDELQASMRTLRKLHEVKIDFGYTDTLFQRMERYKSFVYDVGGERFFLEGIDQYFIKMEQFKNELQSIDDVRHVFIHGDASINNFLITKEYDYPILIDFEFPAMGDPYDDLATFCVDAEYRKDDILQLLELYLGEKPSKSQQYKLLGLCVVGALMWYCWAAYKAAIETNNQLYIDFRDSYHQYVSDVYLGMANIRVS